MRSSTFRWIFVGCSIIIALILVAQVYWLRQTYNLEQHQFRRNVLKAIHALLDDIEGRHNPDVTVKKLVEMTEPNTFLIRVQPIPPADSVRKHLSVEFESYGVWTDCRVVAYNAGTQSVVYNQYIAAARARNQQTRDYFPVIHTSYDYLMLYFPNRSRYIIGEMGFWIRSAVLLLLALVGLSVALLYLYRQKFLNELQKDFVNNFTHEFKTPLAVIKIAADVLVKPDILQKPERLQRYTQVVKEQTEYLQQRVDRLLVTARSEKKKMQLVKEPCLLSVLVYQAMSQLEPLITSRQAAVEVTVAVDEQPVPVDMGRLQLVVVNLLENAIKYSPDQPRIHISIHRGARGQAVLSIRDEGIGMDARQLGSIFKKFYRVPTGNVHNVKGFGLGLHFVKTVIHAHRGKIDVKSAPGKGTVFTIQLPA